MKANGAKNPTKKDIMRYHGKLTEVVTLQEKQLQALFGLIKELQGRVDKLENPQIIVPSGVLNA